MNTQLKKSSSLVHGEKILDKAKKYFEGKKLPELEKILHRAKSESESTQQGAKFELEAALESEQLYNETVEGFDLAFCFYEKISHSSKKKDRQIPEARLNDEIIELPITEYDIITSYITESSKKDHLSHGYLIECKSGKGEPKNRAQLQKQYNVSCWFKKIQKAIQDGYTEIEISIEKNQKGIPLLRLKGKATNDQAIFVLCNWITEGTKDPLKKWNEIIDLIGNRTLALLNRGSISEAFPSRLPFHFLCCGDTYFSPPGSPFQSTHKEQQA